MSGCCSAALRDSATRVLLAIDLTERVLDEAIEQRCDAIVAYHPPIFEPIKRLTDERPKSRIVLRARGRNRAVQPTHRARRGRGGRERLAGGGRGDRRRACPDPPCVHPGRRGAEDRHLPSRRGRGPRAQRALDGRRRPHRQLRALLVHGGGGGHVPRQRGVEPGGGGARRLERVPEVRLEMVCPAASLALALATLRHFHPYEEPPIEIHELLPRPDRTIGAGRRIVLDRPVALEELAGRVRAHLGVSRLDVVPAGERPIAVVGVCAGSGKGLLGSAIAQGCTAYVTGEMGHHDVLAAQAEGCRRSPRGPHRNGARLPAAVARAAGGGAAERRALAVEARRRASDAGRPMTSATALRHGRGTWRDHRMPRPSRPCGMPVALVGTAGTAVAPGCREPAAPRGLVARIAIVACSSDGVAHRGANR